MTKQEDAELRKALKTGELIEGVALKETNSIQVK